ncbi:hypothetical protein [Salinigranum sp. GCM10025319]|uniref:hypothetical protein n=1 Tax=Salinigranum sp. GCM10025319 TaxID=3252687 RepID=UPI003611C672
MTGDSDGRGPGADRAARTRTRRSVGGGGVREQAGGVAERLTISSNGNGFSRSSETKSPSYRGEGTRETTTASKTNSRQSSVPNSPTRPKSLADRRLAVTLQ